MYKRFSYIYVCVCICSVTKLCLNIYIHICIYSYILSFPEGSDGKEDTRVRFLGQEDPLEEVMATHPSILAWRIP